MIRKRTFCTILIVVILCSHAQAIIYDLTQQSGLVSPNFRGQANTTFFGWNEGQFFGQPVPPTASRILNNPATSIGNVGLGQGVELYQNDRSSSPFVMIGSSVGNIYSGSGPIGKQAFATLVAPTAPGSLDSGFTTIVIQGRTTTAGGFSTLDSLISNYPLFSSINGVAPTFVISGNAANQGQWWAQYSIPGSAASYTIGLNFPGGAATTPISIAGMSVDTYWSSSAYADVSAVPEPSTLAMVLTGGVLLGVARWYRSRRLSEKMP
jgi:PEP-CTERM motif